MPQFEIQEGAGLPDWRLVAERRAGKLKIVESHPIVHKELLYTDTKRPAAHHHPTDEGGQPVLVFDLHGTLTPAQGFPLLPPWPKAKRWLDKWASEGICQHIATAALSPYHPPEIMAVRMAATQSWVDLYALPISFITGKTGSHCYYDDRLVTVPEDGDWDVVAEGIEAQLDKRTEFGKDGIRRLITLPDHGDPITDYPDIDLLPPDQPRGWSVPILNVDVHRCLLQSNSSTFESGLKPGALAALQALYPFYTIHLSCAGWDPSTHSPEEAAQRLGGLRQLIRSLGVPYDEFVSKDHPTAGADDRALQHTDWTTDLPLIWERMKAPHPADEVTGMSLGIVN